MAGVGVSLAGGVGNGVGARAVVVAGSMQKDQAGSTRMKKGIYIASDVMRKGGLRRPPLRFIAVGFEPR
jgi:hypothetical protein